MPISFSLKERLIGFTVTGGGPGEKVALLSSRLVPPSDQQAVVNALEKLHTALFYRIPRLPPPAAIQHLLVVIRPDLSATAYVNELRLIASVRVTRPVRAGEPAFVKDISDVAAFDVGVEVPDDAAVVFVATQSWKRSLYFDFGPIDTPPRARLGPLSAVLAQQQLLLLGIPSGTEDLPDDPEPTPLAEMEQGLRDLRDLLDQRCERESAYQELLAAHPWMLGGHYSAVTRHQGLDDKHIPDFTATRSWDQYLDIVELKQPFLSCARNDGTLSAAFNDAWNQTIGYLAFVNRQGQYLEREKGMRFANPRAILLVGKDLDERTGKLIQEKESLTPSITVMTYDHLLALAGEVLYLLRLASAKADPFR